MIPSGPEAMRLARFSFVEMKVFQMNLVRTNAVLAVLCLAAASAFANAAEAAKIDRTNGIIADRDVERLPGAVVGD